jgi:hypothetical protein
MLSKNRSMAASPLFAHHDRMVGMVVAFRSFSAADKGHKKQAGAP